MRWRKQLVERGDEVRVLVRDEVRARAVLPHGVQPVRGDVEDPASLERAMAGVELVFNAMGIPEQWAPDEEVYDRVNAEGTANVVRAAREAGARRVVHTSTMDVFHAERRRQLRRDRAGRLSQGHRVRALQAARRAPRAGRARRHGGGDREPGRRLRARAARQRVAREGHVRAAREEAPARAAARRPRGRVHARASALGHLLAAEKGVARRALPALRHARELARAGGDGGALGRPRTRALSD